MQHPGGVHGRERASDRHRVAQRFTRRETLGAHAPPQVTERKVLHDQPGVLVAHPEVVQPHHRRAIDALGYLVFLQEAAKRIDGLIGFALAVARHFERHQGTRALALGDVEVRHGA